MCSISQGSVVVTFDLCFDHLIDVVEVEKQLGLGIHDVVGGTLVIDKNSIKVTGKCVMTQNHYGSWT